MSDLPARVVVAGVELQHRVLIGYEGPLGPFTIGVRSGREGFSWHWVLVETDPPPQSASARLSSQRSWDTPEEAAANATRVVGLFASLSRGASA